jgi:hypothetical protein
MGADDGCKPGDDQKKWYKRGEWKWGKNAKLADCDMAISDKNYLKGYEVGLY